MMSGSLSTTGSVVPLHGELPLPADALLHIFKYVRFKERGKAAYGMSKSATRAAVARRLLSSFETGGGREPFQVENPYHDFPDDRSALQYDPTDGVDRAKLMDAAWFLLRANHRYAFCNRNDCSTMTRLVSGPDGSGQAFMLAGPLPRLDRAIVLAAVTKFGKALYGAPAFAADKEIVLAACKQDWRALRAAEADLRRDADVHRVAKEGCVCALEKDFWAVNWRSPNLRHDEFDLFRADPDVIMAALGHDEARAAQNVAGGCSRFGGCGSLVLAETAEALLQDRSFVRRVVEVTGYWGLAHSAFRDDAELVLAAVATDSAALKLASPRLKQDAVFINLVVRKVPAAAQVCLIECGPAVKLEAHVVIPVVSRCPPLLRHVHADVRPLVVAALAAKQ